MTWSLPSKISNQNCECIYHFPIHTTWHAHSVLDLFVATIAHSVYWLQYGLDNWVSIPGGNNNFLFTSGTHTASCWLGTRDSRLQ